MRHFDFKPLPEIYQIEATTACQLDCDLCHRERTVADRGGNHHLDLAELRTWIDRGDLAGSYFIELQMSGEPLIHPRLAEITAMLKSAGVLVGMSTNGLLLARRPEAIAGLDAITVSVDSMDPTEYAKRRPKNRGRDDGDLGELLWNIDQLLLNPLCPANVDLQVVAPLGMTEEAVQVELSKIRERFPDPRVHARFVWDCFAVAVGRARFEIKKELCLNPWTSVSVQSDGTVVSCCYAWDHNVANVYGNLNKTDLKTIWAGPEVAAMRDAQRCGTAKGWCEGCYLKSPYLIHLGFVPTFMQRARAAAAASRGV